MTTIFCLFATKCNFNVIWLPPTGHCKNSNLQDMHLSLCLQAVIFESNVGKKVSRSNTCFLE